MNMPHNKNPLIVLYGVIFAFWGFFFAVLFAHTMTSGIAFLLGRFVLVDREPPVWISMFFVGLFFVFFVGYEAFFVASGIRFGSRIAQKPKKGSLRNAWRWLWLTILLFCVAAVIGLRTIRSSEYYRESVAEKSSTSIFLSQQEDAVMVSVGVRGGQAGEYRVALTMSAALYVSGDIFSQSGTVAFEKGKGVFNVTISFEDVATAYYALLAKSGIFVAQETRIDEKFHLRAQVYSEAASQPVSEESTDVLFAFVCDHERCRVVQSDPPSQPTEDPLMTPAQENK